MIGILKFTTISPMMIFFSPSGFLFSQAEILIVRRTPKLNEGWNDYRLTKCFKIGVEMVDEGTYYFT